EDLQTLLATTTRQCGAPVYLLEVASEHGIPALLAYADHSDPRQRRLAIGAGFSAGHAATRALQALLRQQRQASWLAQDGQPTTVVGDSDGIRVGEEALQWLHMQ